MRLRDICKKALKITRKPIEGNFKLFVLGVESNIVGVAITSLLSNKRSYNLMLLINRITV